MKVSAKTEYACVAILELAASFATGEPVRIRQIAEEHGIPSRFLVQILLHLKGAGLVTSSRGATGGYLLARAPDTITLDDVIQAIEGPDEQNSGSVSPDSRMGRVLRECWREVSLAEHARLASWSLAALVERSRRTNEAMYYI